MRKLLMLSSILIIPIVVAGATTVDSHLTVSGRTGAHSALTNNEGFCATQQAYLQNMRALGQPASVCGYGPCDYPGLRDSCTAGPAEPITYVRLFFQVMCLNDGSNPTCSAEDVANQMAVVNEDYLPYRIQFRYSMRFVNSSAYRYITSLDEGEAMKAAYAVGPDTQLNIFVTSVNVNGRAWSWGTFPWDPNALQPRGGVVYASVRMYPSSTCAVLTHELGHCLGLWHIFNGVTEVPACSPCYESPGVAGRDTVGDMCSDTDPTPISDTGHCAPPGGSDACTGNLWGETDPQNYMSYAWCWTEFSPQQSGRMHCWLNDNLESLAFGVQFSHSDSLGPAPLSVSFHGQESEAASSWLWDFGDGKSSAESDPTHLFDAPGCYTVRATVETPSGYFSHLEREAVWVHADSVVVQNVTSEAGKVVRVDLRVHNTLPLTELVIPFSWDGPINLTYLAITDTGLRTAGVPMNLINISLSTKRACYSLDFASSPLRTLPAGDAPVVSLFFRIPTGVPVGTVNPVSGSTYVMGDCVSSKFSVRTGIYEAVSVAGSITVVSCCQHLTGNVDCDAGDGVDISDLSALIDNLYISFTPLCCKQEANVDGSSDGNIDISDLSALIDYLYISFTPPAACQ